MKMSRWDLRNTTAKRGFTLVELIVVIVVIALLATITIVSYGMVQRNARGMAMIADFKHIEEALQLYSQKHGLEEWPQDDSPLLTGVANPNIASIIANPNTDFKQYLSSIDAEASSDIPGLWYMYDNDGDTRSGCSTTATTGVNILVQGNVPYDLADYIDDAIDDGNSSCGSVTYDILTRELRVNISKTSAF